MADPRLGELLVVVAEADEEEIQEENELNEENEEEENDEGEGEDDERELENEEEEEEGGVDEREREREMRLNAIGVEADNAGPRDPIVIDLGNPTFPILVGDLPIHGSEYREILRTCPALQED